MKLTTWGRLLREIMTQRQINVTDMAEALGIEPSGIHAPMAGRVSLDKKFSSDVWQYLYLHCKVSFEDLQLLKPAQAIHEKEREWISQKGSGYLDKIRDSLGAKGQPK
jgi:hypothetical protein